MTETDKAREWLHAQRMQGVVTRSFQEITEVLAAYGAAQYEAGAAQMRERAMKHISRGPAEILRALPLREKD